MSYRISNIRGVRRNLPDEKWPKKAFGDCPTVAPSNQMPKANKIIRIEKVAAGCIHVEIRGSTGPADLMIQESAVDKNAEETDTVTLDLKFSLEELGLAPDLANQMTDNIQRGDATSRAALRPQVKRMLKQKK